VTISEPRRAELAELLRISPERIRVVPNGVDPAQFYKLEEQTRFFTAELGLLDFDPLLLLPVRVTPRKNIELALWVLAELRTVFPHAGLVVTGPLGPHNPANLEYFAMLTTLRKQLGLEKPAVFLAEHSQEYLSDAVIGDFYRLSDALLLTSREEGFGIPVLEAGLAGLPVFCSDIPALRELGGSLASYFSPDASPGLVAGLIAQRLEGDAAFALRRKVKAEFSWQRIYTGRIKPLLASRLTEGGSAQG
jgi:glycosyltransferase involved in cell wall biosynthesis